MIKALFKKYRVIKYEILSCRHTRIFGKVRKIQPVLFEGLGTVSFGEKVLLGWHPSPGFYNGYIHLEARGKQSKIIFENDVVVNNNLTIICDRTSITVSSHTLIGANVTIIDSDFHGIAPSERRSGNHACKEVVIERNVFLGNDVTVLKGVRIGENSIIANGAVVTKSIPPNVIAGGNPARILKAIQ